jgi:hypothetical protein
MAELKREVYGLPCVRLSRFSALENTWADVPVRRKRRVWHTDKTHHVRAEHGYMLRVLVVLPLALRPPQRSHWFSRPCEDGAD